MRNSLPKSMAGYFRTSELFVISRAVVDELSHPDFPHSQEALNLVHALPEVPIEDAVRHEEGRGQIFTIDILVC